MDDLDKGYTPHKMRRKIPKVGRSYKRHKNEKKTFDKSDEFIDELTKEIMADLEKGRGPDKKPRKRRGYGLDAPATGPRARAAAEQGRIAQEQVQRLAINTEDNSVKTQISNKEADIGTFKRKIQRIKDGTADIRIPAKEAIAHYKETIKKLESEIKQLKGNNVSKSIEQEMDEMADKMEKSTIDPKDEFKQIILEMGSEGLKKAMPTLKEEERELVKSTLEEILKAKKVTMDDKYAGDKKFARVKDMGTEEEDGSDDEDEKLVKPEAAAMRQQGGSGDEGESDWEGQVIKGDKMSMEEAKDKIMDMEAKEHGTKDPKKIVEAEKKENKMEKGKLCKACKSEMCKCMNKSKTIEKGGPGSGRKGNSSSNDPHKRHKMRMLESNIKATEKTLRNFDKTSPVYEDQKYKLKRMKDKLKEMKGYGMKKSLEEIKELKDQVIKSYEEAGLEYNDELVKAEMKKRLEKSDTLIETRKAAETEYDEDEVTKGKMLKEEDQVEMGGQDKGGKKDRADKKSVPEIEVGKDADETADEATAKVGKMKKSLVWGDPQAKLRALTGGRNFHYNVNGYYDECLEKAKGEESTEELKKSEEKSEDLNDIIEKGLDKSHTDVASEELQKSQQMGEFAKNSFSDAELADAMNISAEELKEILGEKE